MEPTRYQIMAIDFQEKWRAATQTIWEQRDEIASLKGEVTRLRRENYHLLDELHTSKTTTEEK